MDARSSSSSSSSTNHNQSNTAVGATVAAAGGGGGGSGDATETATDAEPSLFESLEAQWARRKAQVLRFLQSDAVEDAPAPPSTEEHHGHKTPLRDDSKCHVCNLSLHLLRFRHHCRNCGLPVCGVHSKNQVPLPHKGFIKAVRVCDICTRHLVQRRAGYRSPRGSSARMSLSSSASGSSASPLMAEHYSDAMMDEQPRLSMGASPLSPAPQASKEDQLLCPMSGVLYSCMLEEQDNTVDEILYLGTFTIGGRALASRRMSANMAIWKDRMFMLTPAEMLCFKATTHEDGGSALGEVRSTVHLTDILHIELHEDYPRILTVVRSDGRIFRVRAKTPEQCFEICTALKKAMQMFQDAMHMLQRGPQPEDNCISCVTIQHESSLPEQVVVASPAFGEHFIVDMYPSSILRLYVNGPSANGVAMYSCQTLLSSELAGKQDLMVEAEPLRTSPSDAQGLHVYVRANQSPESPDREERSLKIWSFLVGLAAIAKVWNLRDLEFVVWLWALVLFLTRYHERLSLLITTKRLHRSKRLRVSCWKIVMGKSDELAKASDALIPDDELDPRFLEGCNGDVEEAKRRYMQTMQWRKENDIDTILLRPSPHFEVMKGTWLHYIHKKDKLGHPITVEHLGNTKKGIEHFLAHGVTEDEAVMHHICMQEYLWQVIDPRPFPDGNQVKILDMKGISMSDIGGDVFAFMKQLGQTVALYNPERMYQFFIVNPPSWFNLIWKLVSPLINAKTRERVQVLRGQKDVAKALLEFVDAENLPAEYGGKCQCPGGCSTNSPEETDLRELVEFVNAHANDEGMRGQIREKYDGLCKKYQQQLFPFASIALTQAEPATVPE
ncbi:TPA: hypothetical protein N0F65_004713 [Lagenidium giganteum]|uniref:Uncharacterized protein n=1 Tax=Lagenidium giganteum TaxID=4803 RepID=A0AAV2Z0E3_9STRA|nr:TPA: hypothetical protein N0F65_004713 [Lagenidium giganteum]